MGFFSHMFNRKTIEEYWEISSPYHASLFFIMGFVFDIFTLRDIDDLSAIFVQLAYFSIVLTIFAIHLEGQRLRWLRPQWRWWRRIFRFEDGIFHFALGGLLNAFILYFLRSTTFVHGLVLVGFFSLLLWLNEFRPKKIKKEYLTALLVHGCLISFFLVFTPTILRMLGLIPFMLGLFQYLLIVCLWAYLRRKKLNVLKQVMITGTYILFFTTLFSLKLLPPVPLAVKKMGVYHHIERVSDTDELFYIAQTSAPRWRFWSVSSHPFPKSEDGPIYLFFRLFAPGGLEGEVQVVWQFESVDHRTQKLHWQETDRIRLSISGGRREGYRAFVRKRNYSPGRWRVRIQTPEGAVIGDYRFRVTEQTANEATLREVIF